MEIFKKATSCEVVDLYPTRNIKSNVTIKHAKTLREFIIERIMELGES